MSSKKLKHSSLESVPEGFQVFEGFPPIWREDARILILGSMPSIRSAQLEEYYGHKRNYFWEMMGEILGFDGRLPYLLRVEQLKDAQVALWDVARLCLRKKSSDASMRDVKANDFGHLFKVCPHLCRILFNGTKAQELFHRLVLPKLSWPGSPLPMKCLPSTSPAFAAMPRSKKTALWREAMQE